MNRLLLTTTLIASLALGLGAQAQTSPPVGGPDAKGNAPLKHAHTVNDGSARPGANSFTEGQARQHILNSGYTDVTGLAKGKDGVWRGTATHNGAPVPVAMDFKGNVTEGAAANGAAGGNTSSKASAMSVGGGASDASAGGMASSSSMAGAASSGAMASGGRARKLHHHHRRHHHRGACANPGPNGVACSGVSTMQNGVSDRETRAMQAGAHP